MCLRSRLLGASVEHGEQDVHPGVHGSQEEVWRVHQRRGVPPHQVLHRQRWSRRPRQSLRMTFDQNGFHKLMHVEAWTRRDRSDDPGRPGCSREVNKHGGTSNTSVQPHRKLGASHTSIVLVLLSGFPVLRSLLFNDVPFASNSLEKRGFSLRENKPCPCFKLTKCVKLF